MIGGILVAVHVAYQRFGGQGWLKARDLEVTMDALEVPDVFLPMRRVPSGHVTVIGKKSLGPIPYYHCGDQMQSCEAYDQPVR